MKYCFRTIFSAGKEMAMVFIMQRTTLGLIRKFWVDYFKVTFLGGVGTATKSWFSVMRG